jgi:hypothetical protein
MPMSMEQLYLLKLAEECGEVAHRAMKAMQFGMDEIEHDHEDTNQERLLAELVDLAATVDLLRNAEVLPPNSGLMHFPSDQFAVNRKKEKIRHYHSISIKEGCVDTDDIMDGDGVDTCDQAEMAPVDKNDDDYLPKPLRKGRSKLDSAKRQSPKK